MSDSVDLAIKQLTEKFSFSEGDLTYHIGGVLRLLWIVSKLDPSFKQTAQTISGKYQSVFIALSSLHSGVITDSQIMNNCFIILEDFIKKEQINASVLKDDKLADFSSTLDSIKQLIPEVIKTMETFKSNYEPIIKNITQQINDEHDEWYSKQKVYNYTYMIVKYNRLILGEDPRTVFNIKPNVKQCLVDRKVESCKRLITSEKDKKGFIEAQKMIEAQGGWRNYDMEKNEKEEERLRLSHIQFGENLKETQEYKEAKAYEEHMHCKKWALTHSILHLKSIFFDNLPIPKFNVRTFNTVMIAKIDTSEKIITVVDHKIEPSMNNSLTESFDEYNFYITRWERFHIAYQWIDEYFLRLYQGFEIHKFVDDSQIQIIV